MCAIMIQQLIKGISTPAADCRPLVRIFLTVGGSVKTLGDLTHPVAYRVLYCTLRQGGSLLKNRAGNLRDSLSLPFGEIFKKISQIQHKPLFFFRKICYNKYGLYY